MKAKAIIILTAITLAMMCFSMPAVSQELTEAEKKARLESIVDVYILSCENKAALSSSRGKNLRDSAMLSRLKGSFCRHSKPELVEAMMEQGVEPKPYKVHQFLNARFYETIRAVAVAQK
ncbi:MAG: hypothetical protein JRF72_15540 [Deltaproteobacteria bacterium]|nr:hypothetical protein [Deltaproteobacteria bacterium]